ncbi:beta-propeller domain-containing protein [Nostoc sp.]|uniref:WD40 domain-containing protein n=1 Tax=Nostoc sp. TaxID=1180 RepID=UPI002FFCA551
MRATQRQHYPDEVTRKQLQETWQTLGLSEGDVGAIERRINAEIKTHQANLRQYEQEFTEAIQQEYPLSAFKRSQLTQRHQALNLTAEDVTAIENLIVAAIEEHRQKLQQYKEVFRESIQFEYPLSDATREELQRFQQILELNDAETTAIEAMIIQSSSEGEYRKQQETIREQQEEAVEQTKASDQEILRQKKADEINHEKLQQSRTHESELVRNRTANFLQGKQRFLVVGVGIIGAIVGLVLIVQNGIPNFFNISQGEKSSGSITVVPAKDPNAKSSIGHATVVSSLAFSPNGKILASGSWDSSVKVWNLLNGELRYNLPASSWSVLAVAISPDSKTLASGNGYGPTIENETLKLWNLETGKLIRSISASAKIRSVAFSPDGKTLISGTEDNTIKLWNVDNGQLLKTLSGHSEIVTSVAVSSDGKNLVSGSFDKTIKLWDLKTGELIRTFSGHTGAVYSVAIDPKDKLILSGSSDKTIKSWDLSTGRLVRTFSGHSSVVASVAISPDGQSLISGGGGYDSPDRAIRVWNLNTGELIHTLVGHSEEVTAVAVSPDSKIIASGSRDARVKIWSLSTGKLLRSL